MEMRESAHAKASVETRAAPGAPPKRVGIGGRIAGVLNTFLIPSGQRHVFKGGKTSDARDRDRERDYEQIMIVHLGKVTRGSSSTTHIQGQVLGRAVFDHLCDSAGSSARWINPPPKQQVYASGRGRAPPHPARLARCLF